MFKKTETTQKILIPKGTIRPDEDTLMEVPLSMKQEPFMVAKNQGSRKSVRSEKSSFKTTVGPSFSKTKSKVSIRETGPSGANVSSDLFPDESLAARNLDKTEAEEREMVEKQLEEFQKARRQLLMDATNLSSKSNSTNKPGDSRSESCCQTSTLPASKPKLCEDSFSRLHTKNDVSMPVPELEENGCSSEQNYSQFQPAKASSIYGSDDDIASGSKNTTFIQETPKVRSSILKDSKSCQSSRHQTVLEPDLKSIQFEASTSKKMYSRTAEDNLFSSNLNPDTSKQTKSCQACFKTPSSEQFQPTRSSSSARSTQYKQSGINLAESTQSIFSYESSKRHLNFINRMDEIYLEQLKRQFEDTKRKLEEAILLASLSLKRPKSYTVPSRTGVACPTPTSCLSKRSLYDETPVKEVPKCCSKSDSSKIKRSRRDVITDRAKELRNTVESLCSSPQTASYRISAKGYTMAKNSAGTQTGDETFYTKTKIKVVEDPAMPIPSTSCSREEPVRSVERKYSIKYVKRPIEDMDEDCSVYECNYFQ